MVLFGWGGCVWFYLGGMHGFIWGACVVLFGGMCGFIRGDVWFYSGGVRGFIQGGHAWFFQFSDTMRYGQ